jgi:hypothetical protein
MNLITIFNYPKDNDNYTKMCLLWLYFAKKYCGNLNVKIFTKEGVNAQIKNLIEEYDFSLIYGEEDKNLPFNDKKFKHNIGFKLYNLCKETEPFVFVDADAFILRNINDLVEKSNGQEIVMINHENISGHTAHIPFTFLNSGVQVCNDNSILKYDEIIKERIVSPGSDQSLLFSYFNTIGYDYTNPNIGFEWNSYAKNVKLTKNNNNEWVGESHGLDVDHPVYINHYWYDAKPWQINCPIFNEYENILI